MPSDIQRVNDVLPFPGVPTATLRSPDEIRVMGGIARRWLTIINAPLKVANSMWTRYLAFAIPLGHSTRDFMTSRLKNAEERLEKAVARIDAALARSGTGQSSDTRLAALESENVRLRQQNDEIAGRLDAAISRLQRILQAG